MKRVFDCLRGIGLQPRVPRRSAQAEQLETVDEIMNESNIRKSAAASTVKNTAMPDWVGVQCAAWSAALILATLPTIAFGEPSCPGIHVRILDIRNSSGAVACALFESPEGFPTEYLHFATNIMVIKIREKQARCDFEDIPPGTYALAVVHDENMNGKLDTKLLGIPTEGYGFSNDAKALLGAPSFSAAHFSYDGQNLELTIGLSY